MNTLNPQLPTVTVLRGGDQVLTFDCHLKGRISKVFTVPPSTLNPQPSTFYLVRFPIGSPFFDDDDGVIYRQHEVTHANQP